MDKKSKPKDGSGSDVTTDDVVSHLPNRKLLDALREVEQIQSGMKTTSSDATQGMLREARGGAMYDFGPDT